MARKYKVICPICSKSFYREDESHEQFKGRYYHLECYNEIKKEDIYKKELEDCIKRIFNIDVIPPLIKKQIADYSKSEYNYTYSGIKKTLEYFFDIKNNDIKKSKGGIGIIPFVYAEASEYFYKLFLIEERNRKKVIEDKVIDIVISKPKRTPLKEKREIRLQLLSEKAEE